MWLLCPHPSSALLVRQWRRCGHGREQSHQWRFQELSCCRHAMLPLSTHHDDTVLPKPLRVCNPQERLASEMLHKQASLAVGSLAFPCCTLYVKSLHALAPTIALVLQLTAALQVTSCSCATRVAAFSALRSSRCCRGTPREECLWAGQLWGGGSPPAELQTAWRPSPALPLRRAAAPPL